MHDPLTGRTTAGARGMAVSLLTYANRAKVAEALTAAGYPVTRVTVNRWARGGEMPGIAAQMILTLFGHESDATREAAPPEWAERLQQQIVGELQLNRHLIESILPPERMAEARELIASFEAQLQTRGVGPPARTGRSGPGAESPQAQADGSPQVPNGGR